MYIHRHRPDYESEQGRQGSERRQEPRLRGSTGDDFNFYTASATGEQQSKNTEVYVGNAAFKVETSEAYLADDKYSYAITTVGNIRHLTEKGKTEQKTSASAAAIDVVEINDANKLTATVGATAVMSSHSARTRFLK